MNNPRYLHTVFCDDIRQEVGGKTVQVGIYGGNMNITADEEFLKKNGGITIPKLCLVTTLSSPVSKPMKQVEFSINLNGEAVAGFTAEMPPMPEDSDIKYQTINSVNTVSLTVRGPSVLNVSAKIGKQTVEGPDLIINLLARRPAQPQAEAEAPAPAEEAKPAEEPAKESKKADKADKKDKNLSWLGRR